MARQAALLLLYVHGYEIPDGPVVSDFYRQALDLDLKGKREHTAAIYAAMGGIDKKRFSRFKALLRLSDEAMELADRHNLEEGLLRYVIPLSNEEQVEIIRQIISMNLTVKQVKELCTSGSSEVDENDREFVVPRHTKQLARLMKSVRSSSPEILARFLVEQERDVTLARARLQSLRKLIDETEQCLE